MRKALSFLLCLCLIAGALTCLCGLTVFAEADYSTPVREPVTVTFDSATEYKNPYKDVKVDAAFTHEDGTTITLPCFWWGDQTFAFRFSPTKTGLWTYKVTSNDAANTSLNVTGTIQATDPKGDTNTSKHGFIAIPAGARNFTYEDGTTFFWLGDTNWQAPSTNSTTVCNYPGCDCGGQFQHIVNDRVSKGFTVYQTYFSDTSGGSTQGNKSYWKKPGTQPNVDVFRDRIDYEFQYLHEKDLVAAVGFGCHKGTTASMSKENMIDFARYVVARYACYNVMWITGQEITDLEPAHATSQKNGLITTMDVYMELAAMVEEADGYKHPNSAHMYPMMSSDERAQRLAKSDWHDFWTLQGGHGAHVKDKEFYRSYYANMYATPDKAVKPYIEGELNYEEINCGGFTGYNAPRWGAWNALMCGTAGFTYGVSGVWAACFSTQKYTGWYDGDVSYSYEPWYMGVDKPGSLEVSYMKKFFENLPDWTKLVPGFYDTNLADFANKEEKLISMTEDKSVIVCYFYNTDNSTGMIKCLDPAKKYYALWYDTLTGRYLPIGAIEAGTVNYNIGQKPSNGDWALLITSQPIADFYAEEAYVAQEAEVTISGTKVTPASFKAVNGVTYSNKLEIQDPTQNLIDGDLNTVWEPSADRVSLTFYYDLGKAMDLTAVAITPKAGTTVPNFRVYASNDEQVWTILTDTELNGKQHKVGDAFAEALSGGYRYVKVLVLNAKPIPDAEIAAYPYEVHENKYTKVTCSHNAFADLALYASGESASPVQPELKSGKLEGLDIPDEPTDPTNPDNPADPTDPDKPGKKGLSTETIVIIVVAAVVLVAVGVCLALILKPKKKPENK